MPQANVSVMPHVMSWQRDDPNAVIDRAVAALAAGDLVAVPTDTGWGVAGSAVHADTIERLSALACANGPCGMGAALACSFAGQLLDWVPGISTLGMRLARRAWPGPVVLINGEGLDAGLLPNLPAPARDLLKSRPAFRAPDHDIAHAVLRLSAVPVMLAPAPAGAVSTGGCLRDRLQLVIEDADTPPPRTPTVLEVAGDRWEILAPGDVSRAQLEEMTSCRILFVCTGNTCRSPLAQALCTRLLAERLGCAADELPRRGYVVESAGIAANAGAPATPEAVDIARTLGADLSAHRSRALTLTMLFQADHVVTMTHSHAYALAGYNMRGGPEPRLLAADATDVSDPIGGTSDVYRECAEQILQHLETFVAELHSQEEAS